MMSDFFRDKMGSSFKFEISYLIADDTGIYGTMETYLCTDADDMDTPWNRSFVQLPNEKENRNAYSQNSMMQLR